MNKVIIITGPTGVGKTDISIEVAKRFNGEIINADASQFKRDLNIGTAKTDYKNSEIKHHLFDIIDCTENYSISDYQKKARKLIDELFKNNKTPILVGGSGLYINSVIYNYDLSASKREDDSLYDDYSNEELYNELIKLDKNANIEKNNRRRLIRALELSKSGKNISENICSDEPIYDCIGICLDCDRDLLYSRINSRVLKMIDNGLIDECQKLINSGIDVCKITDIGYKEIFDYCMGKNSLEYAILEIQKKTRHFAKRQMTWFRNKMDLHFINVNYDDLNETIDEVCNYIIDKDKD